MDDGDDDVSSVGSGFARFHWMSGRRNVLVQKRSLSASFEVVE